MTHNLTRILLATAVAAALATPAMSQSRQSSDPYQAYAQQSSKKPRKRPKKPAQRYVARQQAVRGPAPTGAGSGCHGWDPDPNVRSMIRMDSQLYDD